MKTTGNIPMDVRIAGIKPIINALSTILKLSRYVMFDSSKQGAPNNRFFQHELNSKLYMLLT